MAKYNHQKIEKKWQKYWDENETFVVKDEAKGKENLYILDMFPYPSGAGLHVGHPEGYTATDILSRYYRMKNFNVLHPMGWDAFGLPAENYAIKEGVHPDKTTKKNIKRFKEQIKSIGLSYDWTRELATSDPEYYKWTQWLFLQMYHKGLAYKKEASVNWCPKDNTVLANEQVVNGACERCGTTVVQKMLSQWFLKITDYAEPLLNELENLDWPQPIKTMQKNWIGKSEGAEIDFLIDQPKVKRFVLLHGRTTTGESVFFPWLKKELENRGFEVETPTMPNTDMPDDIEQAEFVKNHCTLDEETVIVGHSFGGVVAMRLLEQGVKINRLIFVSTPFSGKFLDDKARPSVTAACERGFDFETIKQNSKGFTLLYDTSDAIVPIADADELGEKLGFRPFKHKANKPHFDATEEPEVFSVALGTIKVFTTRPDTIYGATYMVLAPEHQLVSVVAPHLENYDEIKKYIEATKKKTELQRTALEKQKTGVELKGFKAINPATGEKVPVWIADYVLTGYGTGAIMAVPAHDERDKEFAVKFNLPERRVIDENGKLTASGQFDGLSTKEAINKLGSHFGSLVTKYKLRDWLVSRQRYWGAPIPIIYCEKCGPQPVPEKDLPVKLPTDVDFLPSGESPLARSKSFHKVKCPNCKGEARRDSDTMDTFVDSSWYFFRFTDPQNKKEPCDRKKVHAWMPVDIYVGGAEHAVLHLLYSRFFTRVCHDLGFIDFKEPFTKLRNQGLILGPDGEKMSKSRGNVINPDEVIAELGADSLRMYEMFMGPLEDSKPWSTQGMIGVKRFLDRIWSWVNENSDNSEKNHSDKVDVALNRLTKKITEDIENYSFNTAISSFMEFYNKVKDENVSPEQLKIFLKLLYPFAPHISEELNEQLGGKKTLQFEEWPSFDKSKTLDVVVDIVVQVNGKLRDKLSINRDSDEAAVKAEALQSEKIKMALNGQEPKKIIFVPNKLINFVV